MSVTSKNTKQVIILRKDLNMRKGKFCAQCSHASIYFLIKDCIIDNIKIQTPLDHPGVIKTWLNDGMPKIVLGCDSEDELNELYNKAKEQDLPVEMIIDAGLTEFGGIATKTCIAIGPYYTTEIDKITIHLKPL